LAVEGTGVLGLLGGALGVAVALVWWVLLSRAPWSERVAAVVVMAGVLAVAWRFVHPSIANGFMRQMPLVFGTPLLALGLIAWAAMVRRRYSGAARFVSMAACVALAGSALTLVRTGGITGDADSDLHWRWTPTPEERLLASPSMPTASSTAPHPPVPAGASSHLPAPASTSSHPPAPARTRPHPPAPVSTSPHPPAPVSTRAHAPAPDWPGFRGPNRDGVVRGVPIETDWSRNPPVEAWRRPVGPGWSSFAVRGDLVYTQEQRGEHEVVSCYQLSTGEPVWRHDDPVRFWESNGGAGPRATPTLQDGRVYTMGATGIVNALDAESGALLWSRDAAVDTGKPIPDWGLASSPIVLDGLVIVAVAGRLAAYDEATGQPRWLGEAGGGGYSSPHLATIDGVPQVLLLRGARTISVAPADGALLWEHSGQPAVSIVQPAVVTGGNVLIASGDAMGGLGLRRVAVAHGPTGWTVEERWTSRGLKPYFNDFVVHEGHAYGFDGSILAAINLEDGTRAWKGGRYGHGQLLLLPEQDLLLVLSEDGELALVSATPDRFTEVARVRALEGKTWNHPALVGDVLLVRNGEEMAAFRLPLSR
ncbi:MAG: PQQ-binding-like beta-propeller repeat protein, partial [Vicinamibacterales bacterium]